MIEAIELTQEQALALAIHLSDPGDVVTVHAPSCACRDVPTDDVDEACDCEPAHHIVPPVRGIA